MTSHDQTDERENAYSALLQHDDETITEGHWAFGTGFDDPLAGVDTTLPDGIDAAAHAAYCLGLADDALVHAQRLSEWVAHGPELEEEVALANIGLDLLGQSRLLYARAAAADPSCVPVLPDDSPVPAEDALAFFRDAARFRNVRLVELPRGDYAFTMVRLLAFSGWRLASFERLRTSADPVLAAVAAKGAKELRYHLEHAARWVITLAHGTEESRRRTIDAFCEVRPWLPELADAEPEAADAGHAHWAHVVERADLSGPDFTAELLPGGRTGTHTPALVELLRDMQSVARAHPKGRW